MINFERLQVADLDCISVTSRKLSGSPSSAIILCHGFGAPGTDLVALAEEMLERAGGKLDSTRFVFPAAPLEIEPGFDGRCWWPINMQRMQMAFLSGQVADIADVIPAELPDARARVSAIVQWCQQHDHIDSGRILIGGFSQGAMLAIDVALNLAGEIGGVLLWSGMVINQIEWKKLVDVAKPMRVVQSHGMLDPVLPFEYGLNLRKMLVGAGHDVEFLQFQGYHQIPESAIEAATRLAVSVVSARRPGQPQG